MTEQALRSGRTAQELLEDETFNIAINKIENEQLWIFRSSKPEETAKREMAWSMLRAIFSGILNPREGGCHEAEAIFGGADCLCAEAG